ncbi:MAG: hypothetical protein GXO10_05710 [Crenarchaeota archaeon]|nr:hypothetical protein [Thermoproteota archaeon]
MSSRSLGRGRCPKCGQEGVIVIKTISGYEYVYFRHGRKWCYIGPKDSVDIAELLEDSNVRKCDEDSISLCSTSRLDMFRYLRNLSLIRQRKNLVIIICMIVGIIMMTLLMIKFLIINKSPSIDEKIFSGAIVDFKNRILVIKVDFSNGTIRTVRFKIKDVKTWVEPINQTSLKLLLNQNNRR